MSDLFNTGVIPLVNDYLMLEAAKVRDYGDYWSASSAGYCQRKVIFDRLKVPHVKEDARKQRVFSSGHIFHEWIQGITKQAGISVAQEVELQDEKLMVRGHFDDLILIKGGGVVSHADNMDEPPQPDHLILYDYKTQNSQAFSWMKKQPDRGMSHYHKMQLGTYMYMLNKGVGDWVDNLKPDVVPEEALPIKEARILKISKDDLRMAEEQLLWTPALEKKVYEYWSSLNAYWSAKQIPNCTCHLFEVNQRTGKGFMADPKYNDYYYNNEPCSLDWLIKCKKEGKVDW